MSVSSQPDEASRAEGLSSNTAPDDNSQVGQVDFPQGDQASPSTCSQCNKPVASKCTTTVKCTVCSGQSHVGCLVNNFVSINNTAALQNSYQWLTDLLNMENFHHICSTCTSLSAKTISEMPTNDANPTCVDNLSSESMHKLQK